MLARAVTMRASAASQRSFVRLFANHVCFFHIGCVMAWAWRGVAWRGGGRTVVELGAQRRVGDGHQLLGRARRQRTLVGLGRAARRFMERGRLAERTETFVYEVTSESERRWHRLLEHYLRIRRAQVIFSLYGRWLRDQSRESRQRVQDVYPCEK